jgi:hypothetical protein
LETKTVLTSLGVKYVSLMRLKVSRHMPVTVPDKQGTIHDVINTWQALKVSRQGPRGLNQQQQHAAAAESLVLTGHLG